MTAPRVAPQGAEKYDGWVRLAQQAAKELQLNELDQVWTFPKLRHERREFGTAVFSRVQGDRRRIYTGRWALVIRGAERGQFQAVIEEVGSGPLEALEAMLLEVRRRVDDAEPPEPVSVRDFFGAELMAEMATAAAEVDAVAGHAEESSATLAESDEAEDAADASTADAATFDEGERDEPVDGPPQS